jgi:hypothetical protein
MQKKYKKLQKSFIILTNGSIIKYKHLNKNLVKENTVDFFSNKLWSITNVNFIEKVELNTLFLKKYLNI